MKNPKQKQKQNHTTKYRQALVVPFVGQVELMGYAGLIFKYLSFFEIVKYDKYYK